MNPSDISRWQGSVDSWLGQGSVRGLEGNPNNNVIVCDTTGLVAGYYDFTITLSANGHHYYASIEHRNAINDAVLYSWYGIWGAYRVTPIYINNWKVVANERLRIVNKNNSDDTLLAAISWVIRA